MSRRAEGSVQDKTELGNRRGKVFIALRTALTGSEVNDSQAGLIMKQPIARDIVWNYMKDTESNRAGYPAIALNYLKQGEACDVPGQFNADGSLSNFKSDGYVEILTTILDSIKNASPDARGNLPNTPQSRKAEDIIEWIRKNKEIFTAKIGEMAKENFDTSNLDILNREPHEGAVTMEELDQLHKYFMK